MRITPIVAGLAAGAALGLGGVVASELATDNADAQSGGQGLTQNIRSEITSANLRSQRGIKQATTVWNQLGIYLAPEGTQIRAKGPRVSQRKAVGGGLPEQVLSDEVRAKLNATGSGLPGPQGPPGPQGAQGEQGPQGDPGTSGPTDITVRTATQTTSATGTLAATASCESGETATGGSAQVNSATLQSPAFASNFPVPGTEGNTPIAWRGETTIGIAGTFTLTVWALCAAP